MALHADELQDMSQSHCALNQANQTDECITVNVLLQLSSSKATLLLFADYYWQLLKVQSVLKRLSEFVSHFTNMQINSHTNETCRNGDFALSINYL